MVQGHGYGYKGEKDKNMPSYCFFISRSLIVGSGTDENLRLAVTGES